MNVASITSCRKMMYQLNTLSEEGHDSVSPKNLLSQIDKQEKGESPSKANMDMSKMMKNSLFNRKAHIPLH